MKFVIFIGIICAIYAISSENEEQVTCKINNECPGRKVCDNGQCVFNIPRKCHSKNDCSKGKMCYASMCLDIEKVTKFRRCIFAPDCYGIRAKICDCPFPEYDSDY